MKPLLEPAEHTPEDALIWAHLNWRGGPQGGSLRWTLSLMQDRLDAELMLTAQRLRRLGFTDRWIAAPSLLTVEWHAAGGALS